MQGMAHNMESELECQDSKGGLAKGARWGSFDFYRVFSLTLYSFSS